MDAVLAPAYGQQHNTLLASAGRIHVGHRRSVSKLCGEICGHKPRGTFIKYQPTVGLSLGHDGFQRTAWSQLEYLRKGGGRITVNGTGSRSEEHTSELQS